MSVGSQALLMRLVADGKKLFRVTEAIYNTWSSALHKCSQGVSKSILLV